MDAKERARWAEKESELHQKIQEKLDRGQALGLPTHEVMLLGRMLNQRTALIERLVNHVAVVLGDEETVRFIVDQVYELTHEDDDGNE